MKKKKILFFDIETTGLDTTGKVDDIIQLGILDYEENVLFNDTMRPEKKKIWPPSVKHDMTYDQLKDKKSIEERREEIIKIFDSADVVVGFNSDAFDVPFIENVLDYKIKAKKVDVMKLATEFNLYPKLRPSLADVCAWFDIKNLKAHDAMADVYATYGVFKAMEEELKKPILTELYNFDDGKIFYTKELADKHAELSGAKVTSLTYLLNGKEIPESEVSSDRSIYRKGCFKKLPIVKPSVEEE